MNSPDLSTLLEKIELDSRRNIVDYDSLDFNNQIFNDPSDHIAQLRVNYNHIILGRRGSGKTTLMLAAIKASGIFTLTTIEDCQLIRHDNGSTIILKLLLKILKNIKDEFKRNTYGPVIENYRIHHTGIRSLINRIRRLDPDNSRSDFEGATDFITAVDTSILTLERIQKLPEEMETTYSLSGTDVKQIIDTTSSQKTSSIKFHQRLAIDSKKILINLKLAEELSSYIEADSRQKKSESKETSSSIESRGLRKITKLELLNNLRESFTEIINEYNKTWERNVALYLDDFYLIKNGAQPATLQYFHDIHKGSKRGAFCVKISSLPQRLKMNYRDQYDFSSKHDFSTIHLDTDLSQVHLQKNVLIQMLCQIGYGLNITASDIDSLFQDEEISLLSVIASGGIPRDFLKLFTSLVRTARGGNYKKILKRHMYEVVSKLRDDKDYNLQYDSAIEPDSIKEAMNIVKEAIVDKENTNVLLYPKNKADDHDWLLRNLTNLRYLHVVREGQNYNNELYNVYLIDMVFYTIGNRIKTKFHFQRFWENLDEDVKNYPKWAFEDHYVYELQRKNSGYEPA